MTCGTVSDIVVCMLRHVGYQARLVHRKVFEKILPESEISVHGWITVLDPTINGWKQFDFSRKGQDGEITPNHKALYICDSWEDIRVQIEQDFLTYSVSI